MTMKKQPWKSKSTKYLWPQKGFGGMDVFWANRRYCIEVKICLGVDNHFYVMGIYNEFT